MADSWTQRQAEARSQLSALAFLVGEWSGEGQADGQPITARLSASMQLGETFLEVRETLIGADGRIDHADICFYRYDHHNQQLRVLQMVEPAWTAERPVVLEGGGVRWFDGPLGPQVTLILDDNALVVSVRLPGVDTPAAEVRYHHA